MDALLRDREFIGQGLAFPLQFNARGEIALVSGSTDIEQAICIILGTVPGERVMRPTFGCRAWELLFSPNEAITQSLMVDHVREALEMWEPRIEVRSVVAYRDPQRDGGMLVEIGYEIKATHDQRSIVYPFYISEES
ncbi:MAG: GPW/gp25 family protein [Anaerolineae bacterium]|nr:GPW/gp25 family protein [Thermoflexales bacterium]MDW8406741.1 GPW/gp25 family protein [Anaerolineae bacterium]